MFNLWKEYLRWRHSKGFGVHSPFGYRFVTEVLNPGPYGYYSYWRIENHLRVSERFNHRFIQRIKFIIRLAIFLKIGRIIFSSSSSRLPVAAAGSLNLPYLLIKENKKSGKTENIDFQKGDLLIIENSKVDVELIKKAIKSNIPIFAINPGNELRNLLEKPIPRGLFLEDSNKMILIPREEMVYVSYEIRLGRNCF